MTSAVKTAPVNVIMIEIDPGRIKYTRFSEGLYQILKIGLIIEEFDFLPDLIVSY